MFFVYVFLCNNALAAVVLFINGRNSFSDLSLSFSLAGIYSFIMDITNSRDETSRGCKQNSLVFRVVSNDNPLVVPQVFFSFGTALKVQVVGLRMIVVVQQLHASKGGGAVVWMELAIAKDYYSHPCFHISQIR